MKRALAAVLLAASLVLTACGWTGSGTVTAKADHPAYFYTTLVCGMYGKYGCTMWIPLGEEMPESWSITVQDSAGKTHDVGVTEADYNQLHAGDVYSNEAKK